MTVAQLRRELKRRIDHIKENRLRSAADYLAYLDETSNPTAQAMMARIGRAEKEVAKGQFTSVSKLRRKY